MRQTSAELVAGYCEEYPPEFPTLTLARIIYKDNPNAFPNLEAARQAVKYVRGKCGEKNRRKIDKKYKHLRDKERRSTDNLVSLPKTWAHPRRVFKLPKECNKIGFVSDAQVPFQDNEAIHACFGWLKNKGINTLFINGDWIDFYRLSHFEQDPKKRDFPSEYGAILESLEFIRYFFPTIKIYYNLDANHELRYERYMAGKVKEVTSLKLPEYSIENLLKLKYFDIEPLRNNHHILIGKLPVVHGHTIFKGTTSPASTARTVFMKMAMSGIASHCHQTNEHTKTKINGDIITCWTTGCLMDLNVEYNQHGNNYNHGFAYIETDPDGTFRVENKRIDKGTVL